VTRGKNWFELSRAGIVLRTAHAIETAKCISGKLGTTTERPAYMQPQPQRIRFTVMHNDINIYTPIPGTERYPCGQRFKSRQRNVTQEVQALVSTDYILDVIFHKPSKFTDKYTYK
jgi:hypothetical protein